MESIHRVFATTLVLFSMLLVSATAQAASFNANASYYQSGHIMANGGRFDRNDPGTAAHPSLPFCTVLRLTNQGNDRTLYVTIRDRGPYVKGRNLDLTLAGARQLGFIEHGTAHLVAHIVHIGLPHEKCPRYGANVRIAAR